MSRALTARVVEQAKAGRSRQEIPDGLMSGLYLVVQPSGAKSWAVRYRHGGKPRKLTLGPFPALGLRDARKRAQEALRTVAQGVNPAAEKRESRRSSELNLFKNVVAEFLRRATTKNRSADWTARLLNKEVLPHWGERRIEEITRGDVIALVDTIAELGRGVTANRVLAVVRRLFNWCLERDRLAASPCAGVKRPASETGRDRILNDDELRWFWLATDRSHLPFYPLFRLLALTGQRRSEVAEMSASELALDEHAPTLVLPASRTKNAKKHEVPLSAAAVGILRALPRVAGRRGLIFTTDGVKAVTGFAHAKARLDREMLAIARAEAEARGANPAEVAIPHWTLHDLRRTAASGMARLGINLPVIEKVLNHTSGSFAGIVGVLPAAQLLGGETACT